MENGQGEKKCYSYLDFLFRTEAQEEPSSVVDISHRIERLSANKDQEHGICCVVNECSRRNGLYVDGIGIYIEFCGTDYPLTELVPFYNNVNTVESYVQLHPYR